VRVLVSAQPLVFPVEAQRLASAQNRPHILFVFDSATVNIVLRIALIVETLVHVPVGCLGYLDRRRLR
jgi:hypothetical protein